MNESLLTLKSYAKINWNLQIIGKREDEFHELCTIFQTVSLHDTLTFEESNEMILKCDNPKIPTDETNLIIKAARILQKKFGVEKGAKIHLEKRIPAPGGLGGGSSNAAVALLGLKKLWNLEISPGELREIGANLGSDVPFFFYGGTAIGTGRGTKIEPIEDVTESYLLIVTPLVDVPTHAAFARINAPRLTNFEPKSILQICRNEAEKLKLRRFELINDFEASVFAIEPEIEKVKQTLLDAGAKQALLSGSGASVFAIFENKETRQATIKAIEHFDNNWRMFAVATISQEEYLAALEEVF
jgi:4-diphosphocytidyl-2-C-methyl-D-erythritol kinase